MMNKIEKRLCVIALVFVAVYLAALAVSIGGRVDVREEAAPAIRSAAPPAEASRLVLAELFLPMLIVLSVTVSFMAVRRRRARGQSGGEESTGDVFRDTD